MRSSPGRDSNLQPPDCKSCTIPTQPLVHLYPRLVASSLNSFQAHVSNHSVSCCIVRTWSSSAYKHVLSDHTVKLHEDDCPLPSTRCGRRGWHRAVWPSSCLDGACTKIISHSVAVLFSNTGENYRNGPTLIAKVLQ